MKYLNEIKIKSIKKLKKEEYKDSYKYSVNVQDNHNYFMNGGILSKNCITLIDEAQNISKKNIRTILSRLGKDSKMIFLGDRNQVDMKNAQESSLAYMFKHFSDFEEIGFIEMTDADESRNSLIPKIEKRFSELEEHKVMTKVKKVKEIDIEKEIIQNGS